MYEKIGITERGDAALDFSWENRMDVVKGAVLITKNVTPLFRKKIMENPAKYIVHATCTGYGSTILEPFVPTWQQQIENVLQFPFDFVKSQIVLRVDPIIPTPKGIRLAQSVIEQAAEAGIHRFRVSLIDMYPHVRKRFAQHKLPLPYNGGFAPTKENLLQTNSMLGFVKSQFPHIQIESCAEPGLCAATQCGCIGSYELAFFNVKTETNQTGFQRNKCLCNACKLELLTNKTICPHGCLYCYWKDD